MFNSWSTPKSCFLAGCISISVVVLPRARPTFERVWFVNGRRKSGETGIDLESQHNVLTYNLDTVVVFDQRSFQRFFHAVHPYSSNCRLTGEMVKKCYDFLFFYIHSFLFLSFVLCFLLYLPYILYFRYYCILLDHIASSNKVVRLSQCCKNCLENVKMRMYI